MTSCRGRWLLVFFLLLMSRRSLASVEAAEHESEETVRIVRLEGSPYELGHQHGTLLQTEVRAAVQTVLGYFRGYLKIPLIRSWVVNWWLGSAWRQAMPYLPTDYLEELRGLSDGAGVPLQELYRLHAIPDRTYACASFAAWGRATEDEQLIHLRNLDWNINAGIQQVATVFVVKPRGKHAFLNVGWAGFIGVVSGVNDAQLSVGQVGAETIDATFKGEPMVFVMRQMLERAQTIEDAVSVVSEAPRTVGVNYVVADAKAKRAVILETTRRYVRQFTADDPAEHQVSYARPLPDVVFRADAAVDSTIRNLQVASHGDPKHPGLEEPAGSSAYDIRYLGQAAGILAHFGHLNVTAAIAIARAIAPPSNVQSVIFAWPEVWVANAKGNVPAAQRTYHRLDARQLLTSQEEIQ